MMKSNLRLAVCLVGFTAVVALASAQTVSGRNANNGANFAPVLGSPVPPPASFGTTQYSVTSVFAAAFTGHNALDPIATNANYYRYFTGGSQEFIGSVSIPEGVIIDYVGLNDCDAAGGNFTVHLVDSTTGTAFVDIGHFTTSAHANCEVEYNSAQAFGYSYPMNAGHNLEIAMTQNAGAPMDGSVGVQSVEVWWRRVVSPAPAMSDFADVPTSSPQFQFIEALFQAGITAGCGGGNYCPDNPVTRGQMAVLLAKALGLNWPETPIP
jgi:S-layer homology domain